MAKMYLSEEWLLEGCGSEKLGLSCAFCTGGDLIYIFSAKPFADGARPATMLPRGLQELLLFEPLVPLRYTAAGFQALLPSEWEDMSAERDLYVGLQTRSSAAQSAASLDGEGEADAFKDEDSASSGSAEESRSADYTDENQEESGASSDATLDAAF
jgi:hypothetical protein